MESSISSNSLANGGTINGTLIINVASTAALNVQDGSGNNVFTVDTTNKAFYLYNTFTSSTNYERLEGIWASNVFRLQTNAGSAGGTVRAIAIQPVVQVTASTAGAAVSVIGGAGSATNGAGGLLTLNGGVGAGNQNGGGVTITGGLAGSTGTGGALSIVSGAGGASSGLSGNVTLASGTGTASSSGTVGISTGTAAAGNSGTITIQTGTVTNNGAVSGTITIQTLAGTNNGGAGSGGASGTITIATSTANNSASGTGGASGNISITAGNSGNGGTNAGAAGNVVITSGSTGTGGNVDGGQLKLVTGAKVGTGLKGLVQLDAAGGVPTTTQLASGFLGFKYNSASTLVAYVNDAGAIKSVSLGTPS